MYVCAYVSVFYRDPKIGLFITPVVRARMYVSMYVCRLVLWVGDEENQALRCALCHLPDVNDYL